MFISFHHFRLSALYDSIEHDILLGYALDLAFAARLSDDVY